MKQEIIRINLNGVNCYLVKTEESFVLIDTAGPITMDKGYNNRREELEKQLDKNGCIPGKLKAIVLTHGDVDHVANAAYLRDKYHTIIAMHKEDTDLVERLTLDKMMESFRYRSLILKVIFAVMNKTIRRISAKTLANFEAFAPDLLLKEDDSLSSYGIAARIIHLPGHTAGSIAIMTEEGDLIAGDIVTNMKKPGPALNASDFKQLFKSISKLKSLNIKMIYPGHGEPFEASHI
ncbi:MAG TPA: MBL fold metallo-hydrolase [Mobilitalea sp.]|nr:MBL fold metallo-hydrolase [Mobilitalea sp.]